MKRILSVALLLFFTATYSFGQIPNPGFESWSYQQPDGWRAYNNPPHSPFTFESMTLSAHSGLVGVKSEVVLTGPIYNPSGLYSGSTASNYYFPVTTKPTKLKGWYILQTDGQDIFTVNVTMKAQGAIIGEGEFTSNTTNLSYSQFTTNINYTSAATPDSMKIIITFNHGLAGSGHAGSYFILDDLSTEQTNSIEENQMAPLFTVSPNPAAEFIRLHASKGNQIHTFELTNACGQVLRTIQNPSTTDNIDISSFESGVYFYRIFMTDQLIQTGKFVKN
jgi:hypothetical protein